MPRKKLIRRFEPRYGVSRAMLEVEAKYVGKGNGRLPAALNIAMPSFLSLARRFLTTDYTDTTDKSDSDLAHFIRATIHPNLRTLRRLNRDEQDLQDGVDGLSLCFACIILLILFIPVSFFFGCGSAALGNPWCSFFGCRYTAPR